MWQCENSIDKSGSDNVVVGKAYWTMQTARIQNGERIVTGELQGCTVDGTDQRVKVYVHESTRTGITVLHLQVEVNQLY